MHEIHTEIEIRATAERVWSILLDFHSYPEWNPFVCSIRGNARIRERLTVVIKPEGGKSMTFRPSVLVVVPNQELRWVGRLLLAGMFDGEHYFQIVPVSPGRVRFIQGEKFSGVLVPLLKSGLERGTQAGFEAMNQALKARAERSEG